MNAKVIDDILTTKEIITIYTVNRTDIDDINLKLSSKEIIENLEHKDTDLIFVKVKLSNRMILMT